MSNHASAQEDWRRQLAESQEALQKALADFERVLSRTARESYKEVAVLQGRVSELEAQLSESGRQRDLGAVQQRDLEQRLTTLHDAHNSNIKRQEAHRSRSGDLERQLAEALAQKDHARMEHHASASRATDLERKLAEQKVQTREKAEALARLAARGMQHST